MIRVLLVEDQLLVREGMRMILENDPEIEVVGTASNMKEAYEEIERVRPDMILLDIDLGAESALDHITKIKRVADDARILMVTGIIDPETHKRAIELGADGILIKHEAGNTLLKSVKKVHKGEVWVDRALTARILSEAAGRRGGYGENGENEKRLGSLTVREREIVALISEGLVNKEIAARLFISEKTVRNALTVIFSKLGVNNRLELAIYVSKFGSK